MVTAEANRNKKREREREREALISWNFEVSFVDVDCIKLMGDDLSKS